MSKLRLSLFKLQIAVCLALIFSINIFAQNTDLKNDLTKSFRKFDVTRINTNETQQQFAGRRILTVSSGDKNYELNVTPNDLRAKNYRAEETTAEGLRTISKGEVTTFKGKIAGENNSEVRLTIEGEKLEGYFVSRGERFFIEPAERYSELAAKGDFVVYKQGSFINSQGIECLSEAEEKIQNGKNYVVPGAADNLNTLRVIELATEADFQYVSAVGGSAQTNSEILTTLNMVEGVYENELGMTLSVVYQHTWATSDPFSSVSQNALLTSFQNYWNANFPASQYPRDAAHLWTAKFVNQGLSYIGVICNPASAYGFSGRVEGDLDIRNKLSEHELGHNLSAHHADAAQNCDRTLMNPVLSYLTFLQFCTYSKTEISNYIGASGGCLSPQASAGAVFDYDGDRKSDVAVFRPDNGVWYINGSTSGFFGLQFGQSGDKPVSADYDGDGKADVAVYRGGTWYVLRSSNGSFMGVQFGTSEDLPVPADYDGDGKSDVAVFRPSTGIWYFLYSSNGAFSAIRFGTSGDVPVTGNYDGDGKADINLFRPSDGVWYRLNSSNGAFFAAQFGVSEDKALSGDFDGDGKHDLAVWRPSNGAWYILKSSNGAFQGVQFGTAGDLPTVADFDGDGKSDVAVYRPSTGIWYRLNSANNSFFAVQFGISSDMPVQSFYIR